MIRFRDRSIRTKLPVIILVACFVALMLAGIAFSVHHQMTVRTTAREDLQALANLLSMYSRPPLQNNDNVGGWRSLTPLRQISAVEEAGILHADGTPLARYFREPPANADSAPLRDLSPSINIATAQVTGNGGTHLGKVYVYADIRSSLQRIQIRNTIIILIVAILAWLVTPLLTRPLQRLLTRPILDLTTAARAVTEQRDFSQRVTKYTGDEVGDLVDSFNDMLDQLETRDNALHESAERYHTLVENLPVGIGRVLPRDQLELVQANQALAQLFGFDTAGDMMAASDDRSHDGHETCQRILSEILALVAESRRELPLYRLNGKRIWVQVQLYVERAPGGSLLWIDFLIEDMTKRKWAEEELHRYRDSLEELVQRRTAELTSANTHLQNEIADRTKAERALQDNLHFLQALIDAIPNPVFYKDTLGQYLGCNNAFAHLMAMPKDAVVGKTVYDVSPPELAKRYDAADRDLLDSGKDQVYEARIHFADGQEHPVIFYKGVFRDAKGAVTGIIGTVLDITERERGEERLRKLNECFLNFGPAPMENITRLTRLCGELLTAQYAFYSHYESHDQDTPNGPAVLACHWRARNDLPDLPEAWNHIAEDVIEENNPEIITYHKHRDTHYWLSEPERGDIDATTYMGLAVACHNRPVGCLSLLFDNHRDLAVEEEQLVGVIAVAIAVEEHRRHAELEREAFLHLIVEYSDGLEREVSMRKKTEEQLKEYTTRLVHTNEELKTFANIVSHDLRSPLVNLKGFVAELRMALDVVTPAARAGLRHLEPEPRQRAQAAVDEDVPEALRFVESATTRMDRLLNAILRLNREGRREMRFEPIDLGEVVRGVLHTLAHQVEQKGVEVHVGDLPVVEVDYTAMEQIFANLLDNALKYLAPDRPGHIAIYATQCNESHWLHVEDNGRGIADEDKELIFQVFRRTGRETEPGEGMGLAYVRALVRRHGGEVGCAPNNAGGTTFYFNIPKHRPPEPPIPDGLPMATPPA
ncbi:MAG: ATP-binding protein [Candidatus Hydrogenedentota bacterium]